VEEAKSKAHEARRACIGELKQQIRACNQGISKEMPQSVMASF
jgi:hypothetical protein